MKPKGFIASHIAKIAGISYVLIYLTVLGLSLFRPDNKVLGWTAFYLAYPWSAFIIIFSAWSHGDYPYYYYYLFCAMINATCVYIIFRLIKMARE